MNRPSSTDSRVAAWLQEGSTGGPDEGLVEALARVPSTRQHPAWLARLEGDTMDSTWRALPVFVVRYALLLPILLALLVGGALLALALRPGPTTDLRNVGPAIPMGSVARIAYESAGDIFIARADGSDIVQVTDGPPADRYPMYSPDGTRLAFVSDEGRSRSLVVLDLATGRSVVLDDDLAGTIGGLSPQSWSPDGRFLVYARASGQAVHPAVVPADGSAPPTEVDDGAMLSGTDPAWSPDGTRIAFRGAPPPGSGGPGVFVLDRGPDGSFDNAPEPLRVSPAGKGSDSFSWAAPLWDPSGASLITYAQLGASSHDIIVLSADGSGYRVASDDMDGEFWPTWSPDGSRIAFWEQQSDLTGAEGLVVMAANGENRLAIPSPALWDYYSPFWSPDGSRLATTGMVDPSDPDSGSAIAVVSVDGAPIVLIPAPEAGQPSWQPLVPITSASPSLPVSILGT